MSQRQPQSTMSRQETTLNLSSHQNNCPKDSRTLAPLLMAGLLVVAGSLGVIGSWGAYWLDTDIIRDAQQAMGQITKKTVLQVADGDSDHLIAYWFRLPDGTRMEAEQGISKRLWQSLHEGDTLDILYAADNPRRNFPKGGGVTSLGVTLFVSLLSALFATFGGLMIAGWVQGPQQKCDH